MHFVIKLSTISLLASVRAPFTNPPYLGGPWEGGGRGGEGVVGPGSGPPPGVGPPGSDPGLGPSCRRTSPCRCLSCYTELKNTRVREFNLLYRVNVAVLASS